MPTSLDLIVRSYLLQQSKPIHFYLTTLVYARECLREISFDDLKVVNTVLLNVNDYSEATLPCGYEDVVAVGNPCGEYIRPLVADNSLNPLPVLNSLGQQTTYNQLPDTGTVLQNSQLGIEPFYSGYANGFGWNYYSFNDFSEFLGGWGGFRANYSDTYRIIKERNVIKINECLGLPQIIFQYISDGSCCDSATCVPSYAIATIDAYIKWQTKENNRSYGVGERQVAQQWYLNQRKILRSRLSDITSTDDILRSMQKGYYTSPKI